MRIRHFIIQHTVLIYILSNIVACSFQEKHCMVQSPVYNDCSVAYSDSIASNITNENNVSANDTHDSNNNLSEGGAYPNANGSCIFLIDKKEDVVNNEDIQPGCLRRIMRCFLCKGEGRLQDLGRNVRIGAEFGMIIGITIGGLVVYEGIEDNMPPIETLLGLGVVCAGIGALAGVLRSARKCICNAICCKKQKTEDSQELNAIVCSTI